MSSPLPRRLGLTGSIGAGKSTVAGLLRARVLDRAALAALAFADPARLATLNAIIHPRVRARLRALEVAAAARGEGWTVQDVPLLFEGGLEAQMDGVLLVDAPLEVRVARVVARSGLTPEEVLARDARQMPAGEKRKRATAILDNSGDLTALEAQLGAALARLGIGSAKSPSRR
jgi:dephospho-CoA kinase